MATYTLLSDENFLARKFDGKSVHEHGAGLEIVLVDAEDKEVLCRFEHHLAYRKIDEGDGTLMLQEIKASSKLGCGLYLVQGSEFYTWFHVGSFGKYDSLTPQHFCLTTINDIIDVIALEPPHFSDS